MSDVVAEARAALAIVLERDMDDWSMAYTNGHRTSRFTGTMLRDLLDRLAALERELADTRASLARAAQDRDISMQKRGELERELAEARDNARCAGCEHDAFALVSKDLYQAEADLAAARAEVERAARWFYNRGAKEWRELAFDAAWSRYQQEREGERAHP